MSSSKIRIVVVSFGDLPGSRRWLAETGCTLPFFLDTERRLYRHFGLHRSLAKVFNRKTLIYYAEQVASGRELPKVFDGIGADPLQMGGDFTFNLQTGLVSMKYPSQTADDRPSLNYILQHLNI